MQDLSLITEFVLYDVFAWSLLLAIALPIYLVTRKESPHGPKKEICKWNRNAIYVDAVKQNPSPMRRRLGCKKILRTAYTPVAK